MKRINTILKEKYTLVVLLGVILMLFSACERTRGIRGTGLVTSREIPESNFSAIELECSGDVYLEQSDDYYVRLETNENLHNYIVVKNENGTLELKFKKGINIRSYDDLTFYIGTPDIEAVIIDGSGDVNVSDVVMDSQVQVGINGSGDIVMQSVIATKYICFINGSGNITTQSVDAVSMIADIDGSGDISCLGIVDDIELSIDGSGNIDALQVESLDAYCRIDGSGDILAGDCEKLKVRINGSGDVYYYGSPSVDIKIDGSGNVYKY